MPPVLTNLKVNNYFLCNRCIHSLHRRNSFTFSTHHPIHAASARFHPPPQILSSHSLRRSPEQPRPEVSHPRPEARSRLSTWPTLTRSRSLLQLMKPSKRLITNHRHSNLWNNYARSELGFNGPACLLNNAKVTL